MDKNPFKQLTAMLPSKQAIPLSEKPLPYKQIPSILVVPDSPRPSSTDRKSHPDAQGR